MSTRVAKPFRCSVCGALVHRAHPRNDRTWLVRPGVELALPDDVLIPTCGQCGELYIDGALAERIQKQLEESLARSTTAGETR